MSKPETKPKKNPAAVELGRRGGRARAANTTPEERRESASNAARTKWESMTPEERSAKAKVGAAKRYGKKSQD